MTAVLSPSHALRKDRHMSLDDNGIGFSTNTDWREKYNEVADMLAETRAELDDFHQASKELEAELESELQRTEKAQQDLQAKVIRSENERDEWKAKFMSLQTTHNTTATSLQRELDQLRQEHQKTKVYLRELEMGNDDLERNERAVSSSLADMETKYSKALEEKILLEHELLEKAGLEEESQRLKDELRDANVEISILRDQINMVNNRSVPDLQPQVPSTENLLMTAPPPDLDLADVSPSESFQSSTITTPKASLARPALPSTLTRAAQQERPSPLAAFRNSSNLIRSTTLPSFSSPSTASSRSFMRPPATRTVSTATTASNLSSTGSVAKNKGVQMVSEMRARVRNLEQKIHTRVPRLRIASITGRQNAASPAAPATPVLSSSSSIASGSSTAKTSWESQRKSIDSRSNDSGSENNSKKHPGDSSGWVLIMEDSPSPQKTKEAKRLKENRRLSNPTAPTSFRPTVSTSARPTSPSLSTGPMSPLAVSTGLPGLRRPQSRLSAGGTSSGSRPQTPTLLPMPSNNMSTSVGMKRSTGPNPHNHQLKRSSLGKNAPSPPVPPIPSAHHERPTTMPANGCGRSVFPPTNSKSKDLPTLPTDLHANITVRPSSKMAPSNGSSNILSKTRIGRPSGGASGRRSAGIESGSILDIKDLLPRSSSPGGD